MNKENTQSTELCPLNNFSVRKPTMNKSYAKTIYYNRCHMSTHDKGLETNIHSTV